MILGEVKARPKDIISFSLDYISKSKVQTSNPSSSPTPLDTPARPADFLWQDDDDDDDDDAGGGSGDGGNGCSVSNNHRSGTWQFWRLSSSYHAGGRKSRCTSSMTFPWDVSVERSLHAAGKIMVSLMHHLIFIQDESQTMIDILSSKSFLPFTPSGCISCLTPHPRKTPTFCPRTDPRADLRCADPFLLPPCGARRRRCPASPADPGKQRRAGKHCRWTKGASGVFGFKFGEFFFFSSSSSKKRKEKKRKGKERKGNMGRAGGRLWPQFLVACDRNFWSLVTASTVTVSLFVAGAMFGHVGVSLLVAIALFGDVGGSIFGEIWLVQSSPGVVIFVVCTGVVLCSMEQYFLLRRSTEFVVWTSAMFAESYWSSTL